VTQLRFEAPELYRLAEAAMQKHDPSAAREKLERLLDEYPDHSLVDAGRYDLALLALAAGERARARTLLDEIILRGRDTAVRTAAQTLRARTGR
jgi:outer membrane protein assembly factor BamD (BamD/ComL family)